MRVALMLAIVLGVGAGAERVASAETWAEASALVSETDKSTAKAKLEEGNAAYLNTDYVGALEKYEEALKSWDHPAIRFNVVRCQIQLDRVIEASTNLQTSLKFGKEPFEDSIYQEALGYQKLLEGQIGQIEVACSQDGAKLTFDGQPLIEKCPGSATRRVKPGQHSVVATKDGFLTKEMPIFVVGGNSQNGPQKVDVKLIPLDKAAKVVHRWPTYIPWLVFGGGLAVSGLGVFLKVDAQNQMNQYDQNVASACAIDGCNLDNPDPGDETTVANLNALRQSAESKDKLAIGVISVGIVGAAVGGVLLFMNRGRTVYEDPVGKGGPVVNVSPTRDGGGVVSLSGHF
jgi:hypothetical protein